MTTFKNSVNAFGNSAGDSLDVNSTEWCGVKTGMPKGKLKKYPSAVGRIESGNRRLAKAKHGTGDGGHPVRGTNAFTKGGKGK